MWGDPPSSTGNLGVWGTPLVRDVDKSKKHLARYVSPIDRAVYGSFSMWSLKRQKAEQKQLKASPAFRPTYAWGEPDFLYAALFDSHLCGFL